MTYTMLDGANPKIVAGALNGFDAAKFTLVHIVGSTPLASDWLSLTSSGSALTPEDTKQYCVITAGDYQNLLYRWTGSAYILTGSDLTTAELATLNLAGFNQKAERSSVDVPYSAWSLDLGELPMFSGETTIARDTNLALLASGDFAIYKNATAFPTARFKLNFDGDSVAQSEATAVYSQIAGGSRLVYFLSSTASLSITLRITDTELRITTGSAIEWANITIKTLKALTPVGTYSYKVEDARIIPSTKIELELIDDADNFQNALDTGLYKRALQETGAITIYRTVVPDSGEEALNLQYFASQYSTNVSNTVAYITNMPIRVSTVYSTTLTIASGWTAGTAPFSKAVTVTGILSTDNPSIDLDLSSAAYGDVATLQDDWANIYRVVASADTLTFYASEIPTVDIPLIIKVVR